VLLLPIAQQLVQGAIGAASRLDQPLGLLPIAVQQPDQFSFLTGLSW
jgi:hypothetical protein